MKRFSIKDLPSKYSNAEYNLKQMTTNDLKHWKEQGCLDDEETGILWIAKDNEIDYLYIGNKCPDGADDITTSNIKLAIYFDGDDLMVKAKNDVDIEYISNAIDEILSMYDESNNTMFCRGFDKEETSKTTEDTKVVDETIYEEKERFVRISLKSLLFDIDKNILDVYYKYQDGEEIVTIMLCNCSYTENAKINVTTDSVKINVTGDSLLAIVNDVTKRLLH